MSGNMKRKNKLQHLKENKREKLGIESEEMPTGGRGDSPAWDIIIQKLDFQSQMKISQQNKHLAEVVKVNAESELRKFRRHIQEDKYM